MRITALLVSNYRLWMGTGNGVIISVPLNHNDPEQPVLEALQEPQKPGKPIRVFADAEDRLSPETFVPYCNMASAQLSFHGHRDAVKFFVSVPGHGGLALKPGGGASGSKQDIASLDTEASSMLVMSGGEGYIDFRIGELIK